MDRFSAGSSSSRLEEEVQHDEVMPEASKRRRLSADAMGSQVSSSSYVYDTDSDGCRTPPRTPEPHSLLASPAASFSEQLQLRPSSAAPLLQRTASAREESIDREEVLDGSEGQTSVDSRAAQKRTKINLEILRAKVSSSRGTSQPAPSSATPALVDASSPGTSNHGPLQFPLFVKPRASQPWSSEYHTALIKFAAQDSVLQRLMTTGTSEGSAGRLRRFSDRTDGPPSNSLFNMLVRYRETYIRFKKAGLSAAARSSRTNTWTLQDRERLEEHEARQAVKWLSVVHNELYVNFPDCDPTATTAPRVQVRSSISRYADGSSQTAATHNEHTIAASSSASMFSNASNGAAAANSQSHTYFRSTSTSSTVTSAQPWWSAGLPAHSQATPSDAAFTELKTQVEQQRIEVVTLRAQSRRQSELLTEQARLIQGQALQLQQQVQSAEQQFELHNQTIEAMKQQLEVLQPI